MKKEFSVDGKQMVLEELEYLIRRCFDGETNYISKLDIGLSGYSRAIFEITEDVSILAFFKKRCNLCHDHTPQGALTGCQECVKDFLGND